MKTMIVIAACMLQCQITIGQSQLEMNTEAWNAYKKSDAEMTKVYWTVMNRQTFQKDKDLLLEAQRAWIKYKEAHCKALANQYDGGSMKPLVQYSCLEELTVERRKKLLRYLEE